MIFTYFFFKGNIDCACCCGCEWMLGTYVHGECCDGGLGKFPSGFFVGVVLISGYHFVDLCGVFVGKGKEGCGVAKPNR